MCIRDSVCAVRKLAKPTHLIMRIMDCVLLLFQRHVEPVTLDPDRPCPKPSWHEALKLMSATNILQGLLTFPKAKYATHCFYCVTLLLCVEHVDDDGTSFWWFLLYIAYVVEYVYFYRFAWTTVSALSVRCLSCSQLHFIVPVLLLMSHRMNRVVD